MGVQRGVGRGTGARRSQKGLKKSRDQGKVDLMLEVLGHVCHPSTQEGEAGGS